MRRCVFMLSCVFLQPLSTSAEVTSVTITSRTLSRMGGRSDRPGSYERLLGRIEFALDPGDPHNIGIVDLNHARRDADGRVRFSSDLYVLRPTDPAKGNGVLLFEVPNRGRRTLLARFNRATRSGNDPTTDSGFGDGLLMRDGLHAASGSAGRSTSPLRCSGSMLPRCCCRLAPRIGSASRS